jgi:hypothetical protein
MMRKMEIKKDNQNVMPRVPFEESEIPKNRPMSFNIAILAIVL